MKLPYIIEWLLYDRIGNLLFICLSIFGIIVIGGLLIDAQTINADIIKDIDENTFTFIQSDISYSDPVNLTCIKYPQSVNTFANADGFYTNVCPIENTSQYYTTLIQWDAQVKGSTSHLLVRTDYRNTTSGGCDWESRNFGEKWTISYNNPFQGERCDELYRTRGYLPNGAPIPQDVVVSEIEMYNWGW